MKLTAPFSRKQRLAMAWWKNPDTRHFDAIICDGAVRSGKTLDALFPLTKWAGALKDWGGPAEGERPTGFIAVLVPENAGELIFYDAGIAVQTIQLAAHSRGFGC